ncbi:hypothetical protein [Hymenobacter daecheongensis]|nr:hypothetical protein [Hymenobacter daecheongensis]
MASYPSPQELIARVHLGKEVEQWLSHYNEADYTVIRWISVAKEEGQFGVTYFESFDEGDEEFHDVHEFSVIDPENEPCGTTHLFDSIEAVVAFAIENYGASAEKFVASGMIYQEYAKHLLKKK